MFDVDIDVSPKTKPDLGVKASIIDEEVGYVRPHPSGQYYLSNMPTDPVTGLAAIDHKDAEALGFIKIDILNNTSYEIFESKEDVKEHLNKTPDWTLFMDGGIVKYLPHLRNHFDIVRKVMPKSVDDIADILALIRPAKKDLLNQYLKDKQKIRKLLWTADGDGYYFKKSHAYATALQIVTVLNKISSEI